MITHDETRTKANQIAYDLTKNESDASDLSIYEIVDMLREITDYITQQEKVSKLLDLYRQYRKARNDKHVGLYTSLALKIEALEEELK